MYNFLLINIYYYYYYIYKYVYIISQIYLNGIILPYYPPLNMTLNLTLNLTSMYPISILTFTYTMLLTSHLEFN